MCSWFIVHDNFAAGDLCNCYVYVCFLSVYLFARVILTDRGSWPYYVSNDVMKFSISEVSNDDVSGTGRPLNFVIDSGVGFFGAVGIEWSYFRLHQIQDGGRPPCWNFSDDISGTGRPINFVFDSSCLLLAASEPHRLPVCTCYLWKKPQSHWLTLKLKVKAVLSS